MAYNRVLHLGKSATGLDAATSAWVAAVVAAGGTVSTPQQTRVNNLIVAGKAHGWWAALDRLWLHAGESESHQAAIDLKNLAAGSVAGTLAAFNSAGYKGDPAGGPGYFNTASNPTTIGGNYVQNDAMFGVYLQEQANQQTSNFWSDIGQLEVGGVNASILFVQTGTYDTSNGGGNFTINGASSLAFEAVGGSGGLWVINRTGASATRLDHNGSTFVSGTAASTYLPTRDFYVLNDNFPSATDAPSGHQASASFLGKSLTTGQSSDFFYDLNAYMTSVGVNVIDSSGTVTAIFGADHHSDITVTSGHTLTQSITGNRGARADKSASSGLKYFEVKLDAIGSGSGMSVGVANSSYVLTNALGWGDTNSASADVASGYNLNGFITTTSLGLMSVGQTYGVLVDLTGKTMKVRRNGLAFGGSFDISGIAAGPWFPAVSLSLATDQATINCGPLFRYNIPNGAGVFS